MAKGRKVSKTAIKRKKGMLYYVGKDGNVYETPMTKRKGKKRKK